ncbi:ABC transporter substrate-binding protein [uncultured Kushneria sp.]|uniref:ABC transporter substrate-binding protein n=1 Tax=uncultured Kushneria sp. TaxID=905033 RepID=UPI00262B6840|nr:ABC transporter substrate-binding protein [uncultured Kushneria sp.]
MTLRRAFYLSLGALSLALLTGCQQEESTQEDAASADSKRLRVAMLQPPRSGLNPLTDDAFKLSRWRTAETLIRLNDDNDPQPLLATGWERLDERTWRFKIRGNVTFHDGTPLTAEQVVRALTAATHAAPRRARAFLMAST